MPQRVFLALLFGFLCGVFLASFFIPHEAFLWFSLILSVALLLLGLFYKNRTPLLVGAFLLFLPLGIVRFDYATEIPPFEEKNNSRVALVGVVVKEPERKETSTLVVVKTNNGKELYGAKEETRILLFMDAYTEVKYGDMLSFRGILTTPESFETDTGKFFRYKEFLGKDGIHYIVRFPEIEIISEGNGNAFLSFLYATKKAFLRSAGEIISDPEHSLLSGILLGVKESLGEKLLEIFRITGLIHIVVLSGYNVTIVAEAIMRSVSFLRKKFALLLGAISIGIFALIVGGGATVIRASLMALIALLARATGRTYALGIALGIALFLMVFENPYILVFDPSFQLSFLATLGLVFAPPSWKDFFHFLPERFGLRDIAVATLATQLAVFPLLVYQMGSISLVSFFANLFVLPIIPLAMLFGFLTGLIGLASRTLAFPFGMITLFLLGYILFIAETFAKIPFAALEFSMGLFGFIISSFVVCFLFVVSRRI